MNRRHLLTALGSAGTLATAGCLGLLGDRSETGPRPGEPTPAEGGDDRTTTTTGDGTAETYEIEWLEEGATIDVAGNEVLLDRALEEDLEPPYQCEEGVCGVCTSKVDGDATEYVEHDGNEYLDDEQVAGGFLLPCVATPEQDFALETGVQDEADSYSPGEETTEAETTAADAETFDIEWLEEGATVATASNEVLLDRALEEDLEPPYQCEEGVCGVCTSKVDGDATEYVEHDGNEYLDNEQVAGGFLLPCVATPEQDFALETGVQDEADAFTPSEGSDSGSESYEVSWLEQDATTDAPTDETLLDVALEEDLDVPYQCEEGVCGVCTSEVEGDATELVEHDGNEYLDDEQIEAGYVLTCVGYARDDLDIRTGVQDEADEV